MPSELLKGRLQRHCKNSNGHYKIVTLNGHFSTQRSGKTGENEIHFSQHHSPHMAQKISGFFIEMALVAVIVSVVLLI